MIMNFVKLTACLAWAGLAISSAAPADAYVRTNAVGEYAACGGSYDYSYLMDTCTAMEFYYIQVIRIAAVACNTGDCEPQYSNRTDFLYGTGRKPVTNADWCGSAYTLELGECSC